MGKGQCFIFTRFVVIYLTVFPLLDEDQSLSYFLRSVPEWQSGHTTRKQDGSVEWGVTSSMTVRHMRTTGNERHVQLSPVSLHSIFLSNAHQCVRWDCKQTFIFTENSTFSCNQRWFCLSSFHDFQFVCVLGRTGMCGSQKVVTGIVGRISDGQSVF